MSGYLKTVFEKLAEVPVWGFLSLAVLVMLAVALVLLSRRESKTPKWAFAAVAALAFLALAVLFYAAAPAFEVEGEAGIWGFLYAPAFYVALICLAGLGLVAALLRQVRWTSRMIATGAICVALAFLLSYIRLYRLPSGGSITPASMLPLMLFGLLYGWGPGVAVGVLYGMLQLLQGAYILHPLQFLLDYIFPFAALGLAGLCSKRFWLGILTGGFVRFLMHFLGGWIFWGSYAPEGQAPVVYSFLYNISYMGPEIAICLLIYLLKPVRNMVGRLQAEAKSSRG